VKPLDLTLCQSDAVELVEEAELEPEELGEEDELHPIRIKAAATARVILLM
jgi:hypothetical protein